MSLGNEWFSRLSLLAEDISFCQHIFNPVLSHHQRIARVAPHLGPAARAQSANVSPQVLITTATRYWAGLFHVVLDRPGSPLVQTRCEMRALCGSQHRHWVAPG